MINDWSVEGPSIFCGYECFGIFPLQEDYSANWGLRLDGRREHNAASFEWMAGIAERLHPGISTNMADGSSKTCFGVGVAFQVCCSLVELFTQKTLWTGIRMHPNASPLCLGKVQKPFKRIFAWIYQCQGVLSWDFKAQFICSKDLVPTVTSTWKNTFRPFKNQAGCGTFAKRPNNNSDLLSLESTLVPWKTIHSCARN